MRKLIILSLLLASQAYAVDRVWDASFTGCVSSSFASASCWQGSVLPTEVDRAVFSSGQTYEILWDANTLASWQAQTGSAASAVTNNKLLIQNGNVTFRSASLTPDSYQLVWGIEVDNATLNINDAGHPMALVPGFSASINYSNPVFPLVKVDNGGTLNLGGQGNKIFGDYIYLVVGGSGSGNLSISNGAEFQSVIPAYGAFPATSLGVTSTGRGEVTVDGAGARLMQYKIFVGVRGYGRLDVTNGGVVTGPGTIGLEAGSVGEVYVDGIGSSVSSLVVGGDGSGMLTVTNGGLASTGSIGSGSNATGIVVVDGIGSVLNLGGGGSNRVGNSGSGSISVTNGAVAKTNYSVTLGDRIDGSGAITLDGAGSQLIARSVVLGKSGSGTLAVLNGASIVSEDDLFYGIFIGSDAGSSGQLLVDGPATNLEMAYLRVGDEGGGIVDILNGAQVSTVETIAVANRGSASTGILTVDGIGSRLTGASSIHLSPSSSSGPGTLNIDNGAEVISEYFSFGNNGELNLAGGRLESRSIQYYRGVLNLTGGTLNTTRISSYQQGLVNQSGILSPGNTPEFLTTYGYTQSAMTLCCNYEQHAEATLLIDINGFAPGIEYDQLNVLVSEDDTMPVSGVATLDGLLDISLSNTVTLIDGDSFDILTADTIVGEFAEIGHRCISDTLRWDVIYDLDPVGTDTVRLRATAMPANELCDSGPVVVRVDVDPWNDENIVRPDFNDYISVAVMGSSTSAGDATDFDVTQIDPASLKFGVGEAPNIAVFPLYKDYDSDGKTDAAFLFWTQGTGIFCDDTEVGLSGKTLSGNEFSGVDVITTTDCDSGGCHP